MLKLNFSEDGFTIVELVLATVLFPIFVIGITNTYDAVRKQYTISRQLNEIYAVLSACPEVDRALEYSSLNSGTNCYPNNSFVTEGGTGSLYTYSPSLSVTDTTALASGDPLKTIPDSKIVNISVGYPKNPSSPALQLRMLISRNGIGQL